jgi:hypothetical protein
LDECLRLRDPSGIGLGPLPEKNGTFGGRPGGNQSTVCDGFSFRDVISAERPAADAEKRLIHLPKEALCARDSAITVG